MGIMRIKLFLFVVFMIGIIDLALSCPDLDDNNQKVVQRRMSARTVVHHRRSICCRKRKAKQKSLARANLNKQTPKTSRTTPRPPTPTTQTAPSKHATVIIKKTNMLKKVSKKFRAPPGLFANNNPCMIWMSCPVHHNPQFKAWLHGLPSCPCRFSPITLYNNSTVYDQIQRKYFNWKMVDARRERLGVFKPYAKYCIQQQLDLVSSSPSVQQCCYDRNFRLITRGNGAGTPNLVAPELDYSLHSEVDLKPYVLCQGDWTRYQATRSPNNGYNCTDNPRQKQFMEQVKRAREY